MELGELNVPFIRQGDQVIHPNPIRDGLVLWYDFSGMDNSFSNKDIAEDLSGNGNHGTLQNFNYTAESGYDKTGLLFDGVDDYIGAPIESLNLDYNNMAAQINKEIYSYKDGQVMSVKLDDAKASIEGIEVGGRNKLRNSSFQDGLKEWSIEQQATINSGKISSGNLGFYHLTDFNKTWEDITRLNLNTVTVPFVVDFATPETENMNLNETYKQEALAMLDFLRSKSRNLNIIIEPYPLVARGNISETDINPANLNNFFIHWRKILNELGEIANSFNAYGIYISSNLVNVEYAEGCWKETIRILRTHFSGKVIYRKNWWITAVWSEDTIAKYTKELNNLLFSYVDIIAISAYFELNEDDVTSVEQLEEDLHSTRIYNRGQNIFQEVKNFADMWEKPILFGELGFSNRAKSGSQPWNPTPSSIENNEVQRNLFDVYGRVFNKEPWFIGSSIFQIANRDDIPYTPREPAEKVIKNWFPNKRISQIEEALSPSGTAIHLQSDKKEAGISYKLSPEILREMEQGESYVISFRAKGLGKIQLSLGTKQLNIFSLSSKYQQFYAVFNYNGEESLSIHSPSNEFLDSFIHSVQLEEGNKATAWTEAPEDTEAKITTVQKQNIQSYKLYNRALSEEDLLHNYALEKERFNIGGGQ